MSKAQFIRAAEKVMNETREEEAAKLALRQRLAREQRQRIASAKKALASMLDEKQSLVKAFDPAIKLLSDMVSDNGAKAFIVKKSISVGKQHEGNITDLPQVSVEIEHEESGGSLCLRFHEKDKLDFSYHKAPPDTCTQAEGFEKIAMLVQKYEPAHFSKLVTPSQKKPGSVVRKLKR